MNGPIQIFSKTKTESRILVHKLKAKSMSPHYKQEKNPSKTFLDLENLCVEHKEQERMCAMCVTQILHVHICKRKMQVRNDCKNTNVVHVKLRQRNNSISFSILDLCILKIGIFFPEHIFVSQEQTRCLHKHQNS